LTLASLLPLVLACLFSMETSCLNAYSHWRWQAVPIGIGKHIPVGADKLFPLALACLFSIDMLCLSLEWLLTLALANCFRWH
jgi:hypothetical protein